MIDSWSTAILLQHLVGEVLKLDEEAPASRIGALIICLFVPINQQKERLGDFEELYRMVWLPRFRRPTLAKAVYIANALKSVADVLKITAVAWLCDQIGKLNH